MGLVHEAHAVSEPPGATGGHYALRALGPRHATQAQVAGGTSKRLKTESGAC